MANATQKTVKKNSQNCEQNPRQSSTVCSINISASPSLDIENIFYALDEDKVCRGLALMLLQNAVKFNLREFQEVWQQSVPEGMSTSLDQLKVSLNFSSCTYCCLSRGAGLFTLCCFAFWVQV